MKPHAIRVHGGTLFYAYRFEAGRVLVSTIVNSVATLPKWYTLRLVGTRWFFTIGNKQICMGDFRLCA